MIYSRESQWQFLEEELAEQIKDFDDKLKTPAISLMEKGEVFTAQFITFNKGGEMLVRFAVSRPIPRKGEYLYCMTLHKELRDFRNWGNRYYGDLVKDKTNHTQAICSWMTPSDDPRFMLVGFVGIDLEFFQWISDTPGVVLVFGPDKPPLEYMINLQKVVSNQSSEAINSILDMDYYDQDWSPSMVPDGKDLSGYFRNSFSLADTLVLQGPPGTGKTFQIANLCRSLCRDGKSVLVTALTNRALMEVAEKEAMEGLLKEGSVFKTRITTDEAKDIPRLVLDNDAIPRSGCVTLSTFYVSSGLAANSESDYPFDYVIVDEASQAVLPMLAAARRLGRKALFVGDVKQLAPVVQLREIKIEKGKYQRLVDGFKSITERSAFPILQLGYTRRLAERATKYTGLFYSNSLVSKASTTSFSSGIPILNAEGGPTLLKTDAVVGDQEPESCIMLATAIVDAVHRRFPKKKIAVLSCLRKSVRALQKNIREHVRINDIIVDTVARVQGLTTEFCVFVVPNTHYVRTLDPRLFNVATSRASEHTVIITDKEVLSYSRMNPSVYEFLSTLDKEFSFYFPFNKGQAYLSSGDEILSVLIGLASEVSTGPQ